MYTGKRISIVSVVVLFLFVAGTAFATTRYVGPERALTTIQAGINASSNGDIVIVDESTYSENISFGGKNITVQSVTPTDPDCVENTIIEGTGATSVVTFSGSESSSCTLSGFTITGGAATTGGGITGGTGAHANITDCDISYNTADYGAGVYHYAGTISGCNITYNTATYGGGGLYDCASPITSCTIEYNTAGQYGGGTAFCYGLIKKCLFWGNDGGRYGGAGFFSTNFEQCAFWGNQCDEQTAGLYGVTRVVNCCFGWNVVSLTTYNAGVCIHSASSSGYIVHNTMSINAGGTNSYSMMANSSATVANNLATNPNDYTAIGSFSQYCLLGGGPGTPDARGNFYGTPGLAGLFNYHLTGSSAAIDAGMTGLGITVDLDDVTRDDEPDIGCYEY